MKRWKDYEDKLEMERQKRQALFLKNEKREKKRQNREYAWVSFFLVLAFLSLAGYLCYYTFALRESFISSPYNTRQDIFQDRVVRGSILSSDGEVLARTYLEGWDNTEKRMYPYGRLFSHVVGYAAEGKGGLEAEANFQLLTSHEFFIDQMKNEFKGEKNLGDTCVTSLSVTLQQAAYDALGDHRGAVIAIEPSTGRILAEVSKPDFDPNDLIDNWEELVGDEDNSSLLNRAVNGSYPPGSTFKIVTALAYYRRMGTLDGYSYTCDGSITREGASIHCYDWNAHGAEDIYGAFAYSCNAAFADIGLFLGGAALKACAEELLFNKKLPLDGCRQSSFSLDGGSDTQAVMQTAIGQGETLVSPLHMALITCAIANNGVLMKPTLIDRVVNADGEIIRETLPRESRRLLTADEAGAMRALMEDVTEYGTASSLSYRGYTCAGKTGSAEYDAYGNSHSWFVGYLDQEEPSLVVAVLVEDGGSGSDSAVPVAAQVFDAYVWG